MKCLKDQCYYYYESDDFVSCDLAIDQQWEEDKCIGYEQIQKEMESAACDIASAIRKYEKLLRLQERIKKE